MREVFQVHTRAFDNGFVELTTEICKCLNYFRVLGNAKLFCHTTNARVIRQKAFDDVWHFDAEVFDGGLSVLRQHAFGHANSGLSTSLRRGVHHPFREKTGLLLSVYGSSGVGSVLSTIGSEVHP